MNDISNKDDIVLFVNQFYESVEKDDLIGPIFSNKIEPDAWEIHLSKMHSFWNTVLFGVADYRGNPFSHHINLGLEKEHFDRWISLFEKIITSNFQGPKADEAKQRASSMREIFEIKLNAIKANPNAKPIL